MFPLKHVSAFQKLEEDMASIDPATMLRSSKGDTTAQKQMGLSLKQFQQEVDNLQEWIKAHRLDTVPCWNEMVWSLNVEGRFVWRSDGTKKVKEPNDPKAIKNTKRDHGSNAGFALNEQRVAMKYRPKLLETSAAARWIRQEFKKAMVPFITSWQMKIGNKVKRQTGYVFPDMLEYTPEVNAPKVNVAEVKKARAMASLEEKLLKDFTGVMQRLQRHKYLLATPGGSALDDDVRTALDSLAEVIMIIYHRCILTKDQAGRANLKCHVKMVSEIESGTTADAIDPSDTKYTVGEISSGELAFYRRVEGWTALKVINLLVYLHNHLTMI